MSRVSNILRSALVGAVLAASVVAAPAQAQGDLLVAPTRIVINTGGGAQVILSNIGTEPATYRISAELRRMGEDGDFTAVAEADANPAEQAALAMITFAPRRVTLLPGQPQAVRIAIRPPAGLPDGEYRVHLNIRAVPPALKPEAATAEPSAGVAIKLIPVYGITIPVFLRRGKLEGGATLAGPHLVKSQDGAFIELDLNRTGRRSVYGTLIGKSARGTVLFELRGIAIYSEITHRTAQIPLSPEQLALIKGPIKIEYRELPENGGNLIAEVTAAFP